MTQYGWTNEDGEPIMDGAAWRFEQQLDMDSRDDYYADHFYDNEPDPDLYDECENCPDGWVDLSTGVCGDCGVNGGVSLEDYADAMEDHWLDSYMEDRMTTMYEG